MLGERESVVDRGLGVVAAEPVERPVHHRLLQVRDVVDAEVGEAGHREDPVGDRRGKLRVGDGAAADRAARRAGGAAARRGGGRAPGARRQGDRDCCRSADEGELPGWTDVSEHATPQGPRVLMMTTSASAWVQGPTQDQRPGVAHDSVAKWSRPAGLARSGHLGSPRCGIRSRFEPREPISVHTVVAWLHRTPRSLPNMGEWPVRRPRRGEPHQGEEVEDMWDTVERHRGDTLHLSARPTVPTGAGTPSTLPCVWRLLRL